MPDDIRELKQKLGRFADDMRVAMEIALEQSAKELVFAMETLTGMTDHTLADLRHMGHPYSPRFSFGKPHRDYLVHHQSGHLQGGIGYRLEFHRVLEAEIHSSVPYTWYLLLGTGRMRPRDFVSAAMILTERNIGNNFLEAHRMVHETHEGQRFKLEMTWIPHDERAAQLPRR